MEIRIAWAAVFCAVVVGVGCATVQPPPVEKWQGSTRQSRKIAVQPAPAEETPAAPLREPTMDAAPSPATMTDLVRALRVNLTEFRPGDAFCSATSTEAQSQQVVDDLEEVARRLATPLSSTLQKTQERALAGDVALQRFVDLVNRVAARDRVAQQLPWLLAQALGGSLCKKAKGMTEEEAHTAAVGIVHFATSTESFRNLVVAAFRTPQHSALASKTVDESEALAAVSAAMRPFFSAPRPLAAALPAFGATIEVRGTGLGLKCAAQPQIVATNAVGVAEQGAMLAQDSRISLKLSCTNTSSKRWTSESLVQAGVPACAVDVGARRGDVVLPELNPGEAADIVLGPLLVTERCGETVSFEYAVRSSTVAEPQIVDVGLRLMTPRIAIRLDTLDEDTPGSSATDGNRGFGRDDDFELRLSLQAPSTLETTVVKTELVGDNATIVARTPLATLATGPGGWAALNDDLDVHTAVDADGDLKDILKSDAEFGWLSTELSMTTDCELSARGLVGTPAEAWGKVCRTLNWSRFLEWASKTHDLDCSLRQLQPKSGAVGVVAAIGGGSEVTPNAAAFVDPAYDAVAEAVKHLVSAQAISSGDLSIALATLDALISTPLYPGKAPAGAAANRERARQLLLADFAIQARLKLGLPLQATPAPVFAQPASVRIVGLRSEFFDLLVRAEASSPQPANNPVGNVSAALGAAAGAAANLIGGFLGQNNNDDDDDEKPKAKQPNQAGTATSVTTDPATARVLMAAAPRFAGLPCDQPMVLPTPAMPSRFVATRFVLVPREQAADKVVELSPVRTERKTWLELDLEVLKTVRGLVGKSVRAATADGREVDGTLKSATDAGAVINKRDNGTTTLPWSQVLWLAALPGDAS